MSFLRQNKSLHPMPAAGNAVFEPARYFSADYFVAKQRFVAACEKHGFAHHSLLVDAASPTRDPLTIDVALAGAKCPETALIVSSGVHGVEGFFGSAVQLAFLETLPRDWQPPADAAVVFIHALNPFGFAWQRRFNEENIDLNRNFLLPHQEYSGAPPLTDIFRRTLTPAPRRVNLHNIRVAQLALRHGLRSFWETLPVGQYEHPDWLFFGGNARSQSAQLLDGLLPAVLGTPREVVHLDMHTGLGKWAQYELLLAEQESAEGADWWRDHFDAKRVKDADNTNRPYEIRGGLGAWIRTQFPSCNYRFATAEFGTYTPRRVIQALVTELHWHARLGHTEPNHWARRALTEAFAPRDVKWRARSLQAGVGLIRSAAQSLGFSLEIE